MFADTVPASGRLTLLVSFVGIFGLCGWLPFRFDPPPPTTAFSFRPECAHFPPRLPFHLDRWNYRLRLAGDLRTLLRRFPLWYRILIGEFLSPNV